MHTAGAILANKLSAQGNMGDGVYLQNDYGSAGITVLGDCFFRDNTGNGIGAYSNSLITMSKINAERNGGNGLDVSSTSGNVTLSYIYVKYSGLHGIAVQTPKNVTILYAYSFSNGLGSDGDGLFILASNTSLVTIKYSSFIGNEGNGIEVVNKVPVLISTNYFGNDTNNNGDADKYIH